MSSEVIAALAALSGVTLNWLLQLVSSWVQQRKAEKRELGALVRSFSEFTTRWER